MRSQRKGTERFYGKGVQRLFFERWKEEKFEKVFKNVYYNFKRLKEFDEAYGKEDLRKQLKDLYIHQGNDWAGRGESMDIAIRAQIAALEQVLAEWEEDCP